MVEGHPWVPAGSSVGPRNLDGQVGVPAPKRYNRGSGCIFRSCVGPRHHPDYFIFNLGSRPRCVGPRTNQSMCGSPPHINEGAIPTDCFFCKLLFKRTVNENSELEFTKLTLQYHYHERKRNQISRTPITSTRKKWHLLAA